MFNKNMGTSTTLFLFLFTIVMVSCGSSREARDQVFYYNESTGIPTLDPAFSKAQSINWAVHQLYNTLVEVDSGLNIVPGIAKHWEVDSNRMVYTFHLHDHIYFHDNDAFPEKKGRKMVAGMLPTASIA